MQTRIIGDIHGLWNEYHALASQVERSIQVGDFGIGFAGPYWHTRVNEFHADGNHRFIRGNHDDPWKCKSGMVGWIADGTVINDTMLIGGAWSIDRAWRVEGVSWWAGEECSTEQFYQFAEIYAMVKPRVMITHDAPGVVSKQMFFDSGILGRNAKMHPTKTSQALDAMLDIHQPDEWYFGHWHCDLEYKYGRTFFRCLNEMSYIDVEI